VLIRRAVGSSRSDYAGLRIVVARPRSFLRRAILHEGVPQCRVEFAEVERLAQDGPGGAAVARLARHKDDLDGGPQRKRPLY